MTSHDDILQYAKGNVVANRVLSEVLGRSIRFSIEFSILALLIMIHSNIFSTGCLILAGITAGTFIIGLAAYYFYTVKFNGLKQKYPTPISALNEKSEVGIIKYVDDSMQVIKIGVATAIINLTTIAFAILLVIIALLSVLM